MDLTNIRRILVIKLRYIGDVLLSTPVIANLRLHFPQAFIGIVVNRGTDELLRHNPRLNQVIPLERSAGRGILERIKASLQYASQIRTGRFDLVIDLTDGDRGAILSFASGAPIRIGYNAEGRIRGALYTEIVRPSRASLHNVEYQLEAIRALGLPVVTRQLELQWGEEDEAFGERWIVERGFTGRPFAVIHPGARWWFKQWPLERFAQLSQILWERYRVESVFLGGERESKALSVIRRHLSRPFQSAEGLTLLQLAVIIRRSSLFIGNDNGPMHIAAAVGTPVVALFGSSDPSIWGPRGSGDVVVYKSVPCSPCAHIGCEMGELNCMRQIGTGEVISAVERIWKDGGHAVQASAAR